MVSNQKRGKIDSHCILQRKSRTVLWLVIGQWHPQQRVESVNQYLPLQWASLYAGHFANYIGVKIFNQDNLVILTSVFGPFGHVPVDRSYHAQNSFLRTTRFFAIEPGGGGAGL